MSILIITLSTLTGTSTPRALARVHVLQAEILDFHGVGGGLGDELAWGKDVFEESNLFGVVEVLGGEFDVELNVHVAEVVVPVGGHSLAGEDFDGA